MAAFAMSARSPDVHGLTKILVLCTASDWARAPAEKAGGKLGNRLAGYFSECVEQVPVENAAKVQGLDQSQGEDGGLRELLLSNAASRLRSLRQNRVLVKVGPNTE